MPAIIGVMPLFDRERDSYWMLPAYIKMLEEEGAIPVILPLTQNRRELDYFLGICGGFLLTGGQDVSPSLYGASPSPYCGEICSARDDMDVYILKNAVKADKAVLGICRGIQLMNAAYGGTLYQDLPTECDSDVNHHMSPPYDRCAHFVDVIKNSLLAKIIGAGRIGVNSYHHQAVHIPAAPFKVCAVSEDEIVEGLEMPDKRFVLGLQWHPEFSYLTDENSRKIVRAFVSSVK